MELKKFIAKVSSEGFNYALVHSSPNCIHYPVFLPLKILSEGEAVDWLESLMKDNNLLYN